MNFTLYFLSSAKKITLTFGLVGVSLLSGCATMELDLPLARPAYVGRSPLPRPAMGRDLVSLIEDVVRNNPGADYLVGRGYSMQPLYGDSTVLLIKRIPVENWAKGMTVVFVGDRGVPVAHALVRRTARGWVAAGLGNAQPDNTRVNEKNYIGTAFDAIAPSSSEKPARLLAVALPGKF